MFKITSNNYRVYSLIGLTLIMIYFIFSLPFVFKELGVDSSFRMDNESVTIYSMLKFDGNNYFAGLMLGVIPLLLGVLVFIKAVKVKESLCKLKR